MRSVMKTTCCTWVTSLVVRVINVAVPSSSNSRMENSVTRRNILLRKSRPNAEAVRAEMRVVQMAAATPTAATDIIMPPTRQI